jgi:hypothetical protein
MGAGVAAGARKLITPLWLNPVIFTCTSMVQAFPPFAVPAFLPFCH